jgi:hypothetical protein
VALRPPAVTKALRLRWHHAGKREAAYVRLASHQGGKKSAVAEAPRQGIAAHFSVSRSVEGAQPSFRAANAAARNRFVLLASRSGAPNGWVWRLGDDRKSGLPATFRTPPAPYRERAYALGPGFCCVCGQPVYRFGWHIDLWAGGANKNAAWHCACVIAWQFWTAPSGQARLLRRLQARRCRQTGGRLLKNAEVDHRVPLFRVWSEHRDAPWPRLLDYWGLPNLQIINRDIHAAKCASEAQHRRIARLAI